MSEDNSPMFKLGLLDGMRDSSLASDCPPGVPVGPEPPMPDYPVMYMRGYEREYHPAPCPCDGSCKRGEPYGAAPKREGAAHGSVQRQERTRAHRPIDRP